MPDLPADLSFDDWILHVFDHPATGPELHWGPDAPYWPGPPAAIVAHLTRLFEDPLPPLEGFTDAELNKGFWYIASNGCSDYMFALSDPSVPLEQTLGVDLIYYQHQYRSYILVQYKRMSQNGIGGWEFRPTSRRRGVRPVRRRSGRAAG